MPTKDAIKQFQDLVGQRVQIIAMEHTEAWIKELSIGPAGIKLHIYYWMDGKRQDCWVFDNEVIHV